MEGSELYLPSFKQDPNKNVGVAYLTITDNDMYQRALEMGEWELNGRSVTIQAARDRPAPNRRQQGGEGKDKEGGPSTDDDGRGEEMLMFVVNAVLDHVGDFPPFVQVVVKGVVIISSRAHGRTACTLGTFHTA